MPRIYEIDSARSALIVPALAGQFAELSGNLVFHPADAAACRIQFWTANRSGRWAIRFCSWRFRELSHREYWVPGALAICGVGKVASLRLEGPTAEVADTQGNLRASAIAVATIKPEELGLHLNHIAAEMTLSFQIELVRRMPAENDKLAA